VGCILDLQGRGGRRPPALGQTLALLLRKKPNTAAAAAREWGVAARWGGAACGGGAGQRAPQAGRLEGFRGAL
jgi:hypothetical protein